VERTFLSLSNYHASGLANSEADLYNIAGGGFYYPKLIISSSILHVFLEIHLKIKKKDKNSILGLDNITIAKRIAKQVIFGLPKVTFI